MGFAGLSRPIAIGAEVDFDVWLNPGPAPCGPVNWMPGRVGELPRGRVQRLLELVEPLRICGEYESVVTSSRNQGEVQLDRQAKEEVAEIE